MFVRTPPQPPEPKAASWRAAIALPLVGLDSAASKRHWQGQQSCYEPTPACIAGLTPYCNPGQGSLFRHSATLAPLPFGSKFQFPLALLSLNVLLREGAFRTNGQ